MIKMILASTEDGGIGLNNKLPFHCPEDLRYFKDQTENSAVIMGRKTFESLPFKNGLPNRSNYVVTSGTDGYKTLWYNDNTLTIKCSFSRIAGWLDEWKYHEDTVCIIGGKTIYEQLLPHIQEIHHTTVKGDYECDTFIDTSMWEGSVDWKLKEVKTLSGIAEVKIWRKV